MKLYHAHGSCSIGILVILEELEVEYQLEIIDLAKGQQRTDEFRRLSRKSKVPLLELDDGSSISEWTAIAAYLGTLRPDRPLLPADPLGLARTLEVVDYVVATVHMQGFTRMVRPGNFTPNEADFPSVVARGREIYRGGLALLGEKLSGAFVLDRFSIADAALFYVEHWMVARLGEGLPTGLSQHYAGLRERPAVERALELCQSRAGA